MATTVYLPTDTTTYGFQSITVDDTLLILEGVISSVGYGLQVSSALPTLDSLTGITVVLNGGSIANQFGGAGMSLGSTVDLTLSVGSSVVSGAAAAIETHARALLDLTNAGLIRSSSSSAIDLFSEQGVGTNRISNTGTIWSDDATALQVHEINDSFIDNWGTIRGAVLAIDFSNGNDTLNNYGTIIGQASLSGGTDYVLNEGTMRANLAIFTTAAAVGNKTLINHGHIEGTGGDAIYFALGDDTFTNDGVVDGQTHLGGGTDRVTNSGTMRAGVLAINGTDGGNKTISNHGLIEAGDAGDNIQTAISLSDGNDRVYNYGTIVGTVQLGAGDDVFKSFGIEAIGSEAAVLGGVGNDTIYGTAGDNWYAGGDDTDSLYGRDGNDTLAGDDASDGLHGGRGDDSLDGGEGGDDLWGDDGDDILNGGNGADYLEGGRGDDLLLGGAGNNEFVGGAGADVFFGGGNDDSFDLGADTTDTISDAGGDDDRILTTISRSLTDYGSIEHLTLSGTANINATGTAGANNLVGNDGNNILDGLTGADTLEGGLGSDTYVLRGDATGIATVTDTGGLADLITTTITRDLQSFAGIENATLLGSSAGNLTGSALANVLTGSSAANVLSGLAANDTIGGGAGNDTLVGGLGKDSMTGGASNDVFKFLAVAESVVGSNADVITDFDDSGNDRIDLSALLGPALTYKGTGAFTGVGQVHVVKSGGDVIVEVNTGGSLAADFAIKLSATAIGAMGADDFIL